jgi:hypothetical protein
METKKLETLGLTPEEEKAILQELKEKHEPDQPEPDKIIQEFLNDKFPKQ